MFNVRPDQFWPWIRFEPPSEDPPGFHMAADGSIRVPGESDSGFPSYGSGTNPSAPFDIEFGNAYRAASGSFDGQRNGAGLIPSFGSGSLPPFATSLLFPRLSESQTMWSGPQGHVGEPEARPGTSVPGLHHFKPPADDPPGFRVAADGSVRDGSPNDRNLWLLGYDPHADVTPPTGISSDALRPFQDGSNPFDLLGRQRLNADPIPSFDGGSLPPDATSLLFPRMTEPRFSWSGLLDDGGEPDAGPDGPLPGFRVEPSTDEPSTSRIPGDDSVGDDLSDHFDVSSFGYNPVADVASPIEALAAGGFHPLAVDPATYLPSDPAHFPAPPRHPVQEALDQIARIYRIDWQGSDGRPTAFRGGESANEPTAAVGRHFRSTVRRAHAGSRRTRPATARPWTQRRTASAAGFDLSNPDSAIASCADSSKPNCTAAARQLRRGGGCRSSRCRRHGPAE